MNLEKLVESSHRVIGYSLTGTFGGAALTLAFNEDYKTATVSLLV